MSSDFNIEWKFTVLEMSLIIKNSQGQKVKNAQVK